MTLRVHLSLLPAHGTPYGVDQKLSRSRATCFSLLVQRKGERKHLPRHINPDAGLLSGFFDSPSVANRKTADILSAARWVWLQFDRSPL
jgi:hypothetical protein